jgi:3-dehydroquinate synthetase
MLGIATGRIRELEAARIIRLVASVGPLPSMGAIRGPRLEQIMSGDKKARAGQLRWVLPRGIGKVQRGVVLPWKLIARTISELPELAARARG